jgi:hypothetical protein
LHTRDPRSKFRATRQPQDCLIDRERTTRNIEADAAGRMAKDVVSIPVNGEVGYACDSGVGAGGFSIDS